MPPSGRPPAVLVLSLLVLSTGCLGVLTGTEPLVLEAEPATVSGPAAADAGYEEARRTSQELTREVSAAGQTREVTVTNHLAEYARSVAIEPVGSGEFARFVVVSTPAVELFGRTFNPVGDLSNRELVEQVQSEYEGLENLRAVGERQRTVLGSETTVSTFAGDARLGATDRTVELTVHVTRVRDGPDFVIAIGVHPSAVPGEAERIDRLLSGIQH